MKTPHKIPISWNEPHPHLEKAAQTFWSLVEDTLVKIPDKDSRKALKQELRNPVLPQKFHLS